MKKVLLSLLALGVLAFGVAQTMDKDKMGKDTMGEAMMVKGYTDYSSKAFEAAASQKRVLFFAASWCPTCRAANADITAKLGQIPKEVVIFKVDYDKETALKTKYGITRQHTFVLVDPKGMGAKKWSGGNLAEILAAAK
jgi:thioredoxin 1